MCFTSKEKTQRGSDKKPAAKLAKITQTNTKDLANKLT